MSEVAPGFLKVNCASSPEFSIVASDWLAAHMPASQKACKKIRDLTLWQCCNHVMDISSPLLTQWPRHQEHGAYHTGCCSCKSSWKTCINIQIFCVMMGPIMHEPEGPPGPQAEIKVNHNNNQTMIISLMIFSSVVVLYTLLKFVLWNWWSGFALYSTIVICCIT